MFRSKPVILIVALMASTTTHGRELKQFYQELLPLNAENRVLKSTQNFVDAPSGLDPLGDGKGIDPKPLFNLNKFDCTTYVETNLAIAFSKNLNDVPFEMTRIRYQSGTPDYFQRNHFMVTDWIPANAQKGFVTDVTGQLTHDPSAYRLGKKVLNKTVWFYHRVIDLLDHQKKPPREILRDLSMVPVLPVKEEKTTFLLASYFREHEEEMAGRLPPASIVLFIRNIPSTPTLVNHMGFVVKRDGKLFLNHAPQTKPWKVQEIPLDDYFKDMDSHRAPIEGLLFLKIGR